MNRIIGAGIMFGDMDAVRGIGRARAAGDEADTRSTREASLGQRHHRRPRLLTADEEFDGGVAQRVQGGQKRFARDAERPADPLNNELINEDLAAVSGERDGHELLFLGRPTAPAV